MAKDYDRRRSRRVRDGRVLLDDDCLNGETMKQARLRFRMSDCLVPEDFGAYESDEVVVDWWL